MIAKNIFTVQKLKSALVLFTAVLMLSACGGGESTTPQQNTNTPVGTQLGCGTLNPAPGTADINSFCNEFWSKSNLQNTCATCHKEDQAPLFMRDDNINIAYADINQLSIEDPSKYIVDVNNPSQSYILDKVASGHNCWVADNDQVCVDLILGYINNWVGETAGASTEIPLSPPTNTLPPGGGKEFPANATTPTGSSFEDLIYNPILIPYCATCHDSGPGDPLFAGSNVETSYLLSQPRINLDDPVSSRFVTKLLTHTQGCWDVSAAEFPDITLTGDACTDSSAAMADAIMKFAANITTTAVDPSLYIISRAMKIPDGIVASGGARFEANQIALYQFKTGDGSIAYDTSTSGTALDLTLTDGVTWEGGWGIGINGSGQRAQSSSTNSKLHDLIQATGEYSIEAWVAPNNVTQENARIINYSGGGGDKNFALSQTQYNYDAQVRNSITGLDGEPALSTLDADEALQATLQHVVSTYDPVNGRQIYVNGELKTALVTDPAATGTIGNWNNQYSLVLGDERGANNDNNLWRGVVKLVSIHNRALTSPQIQQNFDAGVGEKFFLLFDISHIQDVPAQSYIMFTVSQFDNYSYLFTDPKYVNLDSGITNVNIPIKSMRIGVNSKQSPAGQAYLNLDTVITANNQSLSLVGTTVALEKNSVDDEFYLIFQTLGSESRTYDEPNYTAQVPPDIIGGASDIGLKTFDEINETFAAMLGISTQATYDGTGTDNDYDIPATYDLVKQQLPSSADINTFVTAHNIGVTQLAMEYCQAVVVNAGVRLDTTTLFGSYNFNQVASLAFANPTSSSLVIDPLLAAANGSGMDLQMDDGTYTSGGTVPDANPTGGNTTFTTKSELISLITNLNQCVPTTCDSAAQTQIVTKAVCTAALAGANTLIQ